MLFADKSESTSKYPNFLRKLSQTFSVVSHKNLLMVNSLPIAVATLE